MAPGANLRKFDLNLLVALDALLHTRSVTRAGEQLNLTQSAVSAELRRLRRMFGDELLVRVGRQYELTALAQDLIEPVSDVVARIKRTIEHRRTFDPAVEARRFSVVMSDYAMLLLLQPALCRAAKQAPGVGLETRQFNDQIQRLLGQSGIDLVIGPNLDLDGVHSQRLFSDRFVCIVSDDNPEVGDELTAEQFESLPHLSIAWQSWLGNPHMQRPGAGSFTGNLVGLMGPRSAGDLSAVYHSDVIADSFTLAPFLVRGTRLVAVVPERLAEHFREMAGIRIMEPPFKAPDLHETMYWTDLADTDPAHAWLRGMIMDVAAGIPEPAVAGPGPDQRLLSAV
ncbi:LysR family transcriptional regulator [Streptomyces sp. NPDC058086]|uniref:LysR family transcriptional regulator n=1 Tax=Streptomyces sp. NPDC058086 TaxID=3346334 RepID=UPI0036E391EA